MALEILFFGFFLLATANDALSQRVESLPGFPGKLPLKLETGYVGVGNSETVQLFYYFFESENNPDDDPLLLWLAGGPGCTGFTAIVYEVGPLSFDYANSTGHKGVPKLKLNPYSWTKIASMIFIDAPVGTGFSYATNAGAYEICDTISAAQTYEFLQKWLLSHPQFLKNPLYITGDSYSGIVLPIVVQKISEGIEAGHKPLMNLKGYTLGNPATDDSIDINWRVPFAHRTGLISDSLYEDTKRSCKGDYVNVDTSNGACLKNLEVVDECTKMVQRVQILEPNCDPEAAKPKGWPLSILSEWDPSSVTENSLELLSYLQAPNKRWCRFHNYLFSSLWVNNGDVQTALHVRKGTVKQWNRCNNSLSYTQNVACSVPYHKSLIKNGYQVLIYSGDHDTIVPYLGTMAWVKSLNLSIHRKWEPWYVDEQVAGYTFGYTHKNYSLVYATVKGAGHTAPEYKPKECLAMISRWLARSPL